MDENLEQGIKINLISSRKLDSMSSQEKLRFILDQVKDGVVLVLERGLTAVEEIDLIKSTMSEIDHDTFIGIEMQSYSPNDLEAGSWFSRILGRSRVPKMSVIGPATLLKPIRKDGNIIQAMILTGKAIQQEIPEEPTEDQRPEDELGQSDETSYEGIEQPPAEATEEQEPATTDESDTFSPPSEQSDQEISTEGAQPPPEDTDAGAVEPSQENFEVPPPPPVTEIAPETQEYIETPPVAQEVVGAESQSIKPAEEPPAESEQYTSGGENIDTGSGSTDAFAEDEVAPEPGPEQAASDESAPPPAAEAPDAEGDSENEQGTGFLYRRLKQEEE
ncbi:MAG: DUF2073 domain-containing protein [Thermoplasmata archaeon]|nr:DUF2073 domain-containing protein [Thermoplasmata archaeon]